MNKWFFYCYSDGHGWTEFGPYGSWSEASQARSVVKRRADRLCDGVSRFFFHPRRKK